MRLFTQPLADARPLVQDRETKERLVLWPETRRAPVFTAALRQAILNEVYLGDYHQDVSDLPRIASAIKTGAENVVFWGEAAEIARLRAALEAGDRSSQELARSCAFGLGTATFLDRSDRFGPGIFELGRTGSLSRSVSLTAANLAAIDLHWDEPEPARSGIVYCTPRNRASAPRIPGGMGVQRFHQRVARSVFLGFAPWHIMSAQQVEWLELRALLKDPSAIIQRCHTAPAPVVVGEAAKALIDGVMAGLGLMSSVIAQPGPPVRAQQPGRAPDQHQACFLTQAQVVEHLESDERAFSSHLDDHSTMIIRLRLERETAGVQFKLIKMGFALLALEFPLRPGEAWTGQFVRVHPRLSIADPAYFRHVLPCPNEAALMAHSRSVTAQWCGMEAAS